MFCIVVDTYHVVLLASHRSLGGPCGPLPAHSPEMHPVGPKALVCICSLSLSICPRACFHGVWARLGQAWARCDFAMCTNGKSRLQCRRRWSPPWGSCGSRRASQPMLRAYTWLVGLVLLPGFGA